jgi:polyisoprenoid-binding protein YceI
MKTKSVLAIAILGSLVMFQPSCTKEVTETVTEYIPTYLNPDDTLKPPSEEGAVNSTNSTWTFDKTHSNVNWETEYYGDHAYLTGKFNNFKIDIVFDNASYETTQINAWVQLSTYNTGEPGRDGPGKCGPGYVGVKYLDTLFTPDPATDSAFFKSTSTRIEKDMYVATGTFTFMGVTKTVDMYYTFTGITNEMSQGKASKKAGFKGMFKFNAISDFGVTSTSIADEMIVTVNANYNLPQ